MPTLPGDHIHGRAIVSNGCAISDGGLTKREYFAAAALQMFMRNDHGNPVTVAALAFDAVAVADALIEALNK